MIGAEPFLAFVKANIEFQFVQPVFALPPDAADFAHGFLHLERTLNCVHDVAAIRLWKKIIDHAIANVLAMGGVVFPNFRLHRAPDIIDELKIFFRRQFGTYFTES